MTDIDQRFVRQSLLIPDKMRSADVLLIGAGMIGSWTAHSLARTVGRVLCFDGDKVSRENIGTQAYTSLDVGQYKSVNLGDFGLQGLPFDAHMSMFDPTHDESTGEMHPTLGELGIESDRPRIVVSAVDNMHSRWLIARWAGRYADLFVDGRVHGNVAAVYTVQPGRGDIERYMSEIERDGPPPKALCGAEGTAYVGMWVASTITATINRWARGLPVPFSVVHDVLMGQDLSTVGTAEGVMV